jgi:hypothetical protein
MDVLEAHAYALRTAEPLVGEDAAWDIAQSVALILLDWPWISRWSKRVVYDYTMALASEELEYRRRFVLIPR